MRSKEIKFRRGDRFVATIKSVRIEGVYIEMPGGVGEGVVSARCWGNGKKRKVAMALLKPGDKISVVVKWFYPQTKILSLVLPNDGTTSKLAQTKVQMPHNASGKNRPSRKPTYHPIAPGAVLLIDTANLFGAIGHDNAAHNLECILQKLQEWGYGVVFFMERRTQTWCVCQQDSPSAAGAFMDFCAKSNVTLVDGESDLAMLQVARSVDNAVCCSRDRFKDYADAYSDIVNGPRKRSFSSVQINKKKCLSIEGVPAAIVLEMPREAPVLNTRVTSCSPDESMACHDCASAKHVYEDPMVEKEERIRRRIERRNARIRAELRRAGSANGIRFSSRKRAMRLTCCKMEQGLAQVRFSHAA